MHPNLLRIIHSTVLSRSVKFNYNKIPKTLPSLLESKTDIDKIKNDYDILAKHFSHPLFVNYVPSYNELQNNEYTAWLNLYIRR